MSESISIESLPNTSPITIKRLKSLDIQTYSDLINHFPSRYEDFSIMSSIAKAQPGETVTVKGAVVDAKYRVTRTGLKLQVFKVADGTGEIEVGFYNQPYLLRLIKKGNMLSVAGVVEQFGRKLSLKPKEYELVNDDNFLKHTGRIVPVYPQTRGLSTKTIREKVYIALRNKIPEILPDKIIKFNNLAAEEYAYQNIHFPESTVDAEKARERLAFDELFSIQLSSSLIKLHWEKEVVGHKFKDSGKSKKAIADFIGKLPFTLTASQLKVWNEIYEDLKKEKPMNRFLQGEVGSGKTVVAALACYFAYLNGFKSIVMAPTEILTTQHYKTLSDLFKDSPLKIGIYTASNKNPEGDIIVGTHALITKKFKLKKIGFVVIDEQHRFGVAQRAALKEKGINPHLLTMTATPIPRTVMLTMHGELDLSAITEMPKGRLPVKTYLVPPHKRPDGYEWIKKQIVQNNAQVFVVCPLIEESAVETMKSVKASKKEYDDLKKIFFGQRLGLLHGKMKSVEKEKVMSDFKKGDYDILVTTPVVEVGVDIPKATIMIIEGAERFGLAQLHQLRGRVGRSYMQSYCFLYATSHEPEMVRRLEFFSKTTLGTRLAEEDLKVRGPGNIFGMKQHGFLDLKIASFTDYPLIEKSKKAADYFIGHYKISDFDLLKARLDKLETDGVTRD
jgi:ATP-dependent DNA helicase RecG